MGNCFGSNAPELEAVKVMAQANHAHPQGMIPTLVIRIPADHLNHQSGTDSGPDRLRAQFILVVAMAKRVMAASNAHAVVSPAMPGKSPQSAPTTTSRRPESSSALNGVGAANPEGRILKAANLRVFTFAELKAATRSFKSDTVLGEGGFGRVYKGWVDETTMNPARSGAGVPVAVKKLNPESLQGVQEWQVRIKPFFFSGEAIFLPTF
jgi:hypothetical protein